MIFLGIKYEPLSDPAPVIKICEWGPWGLLCTNGTLMYTDSKFTDGVLRYTDCFRCTEGIVKCTVYCVLMVY